VARKYAVDGENVARDPERLRAWGVWAGATSDT
jgi:hypothetical protein